MRDHKPPEIRRREMSRHVDAVDDQGRIPDFFPSNTITVPYFSYLDTSTIQPMSGQISIVR